jgi:hypothetical protein
MDLRGLAIGEAAGHGDAQPWSHIAGGRASTEDFVGCKGLEGDCKKKQDWDAHEESVKRNGKSRKPKPQRNRQLWF